MKNAVTGLFFCFYLSLGNFGNQAVAVTKTDEFKNPLRQCWEIKSRAIRSFASDNNLLFFMDDEGQIISTDINDQQELWKTSVGKKTQNSLQIYGNHIYIFSKSEENKIVTLRKISKQTGVTENIFDFTNTIDAIPLTDTNFQNFVLITPERNILFTKLTDKKNERLNDLPVTNQSDKSKRNNFVFDFTDNAFAIFDGSSVKTYSHLDGSLKNEIVPELREGISSILLNDDSLFWGDVSGNVYYFNPTTKSVKKILRTGGKISWIDRMEAKVLIASDDNFVQLLSVKNKKILWKKRLPGRINLKPVQTENLLVLAATGENTVFFLDKKSGRVYNQSVMEDDEFISEFQLNGNYLIVLTNKRLRVMSENCEAK